MSGGYGGSGSGGVGGNGNGGNGGNGNYPHGNPGGGGQWNQGGVNPQHPYQAPQPVYQHPQQHPFPQQPIPQHPQQPDHFRETVAPGMKLFGQSLGLSFGFFLGMVLIFVFIPMLLCGGCVMMGMVAGVADSASSSRSRESRDWRDIDEPLNSGSQNNANGDTGPRVLPGGGIDSGR